MSETLKKQIKELMEEYLRDLVLQSHNQTAKTTSNIMGEIHDIKQDVLDIKQGQERTNVVVEEVKRTLIEMDKRAVNWDLTTKIVYALVGVILTTVIGALLVIVLS